MMAPRRRLFINMIMPTGLPLRSTITFCATSLYLLLFSHSVSCSCQHLLYEHATPCTSTSLIQSLNLPSILLPLFLCTDLHAYVACVYTLAALSSHTP